MQIVSICYVVCYFELLWTESVIVDVTENSGDKSSDSSTNLSSSCQDGRVVIFKKKV